jgi:hypothetical protein
MRGRESPRGDKGQTDRAGRVECTRGAFR